MRRLVGVVLVLTGCASAPAPEPTASAPGPPPAEPEVEALYERLAAGEEEYCHGLELVLGGEDELGSARLEAGTLEIVAGALQCETLAGCEPARFVDALHRLLTANATALTDQTSRLRDLEPTVGLAEEPGASAFVGAVSTPEAGVRELRGRDLAEIIELNGPVLAAIDDWLTWLRPSLMEAFENYRFLRDRMAPVYQASDLPEALLFGFLATESGAKVHAFSSAGAAGPLQFMSYTGRRFGLREVDGFDLRLDPESSARANVAYLDEQLAKLGGSLEHALAAYNGGESRMGRLYRSSGGAPLWDASVYYALPKETRQYVPRVLAAAWLFLHPERYGLEPPVRAIETVELELEEPLAVGELTVCLGQVGDQPYGWFRALRNLNPRLEPGDRVDRLVVPRELVAPYRERCLDGELVAAARQLHEANYPDRSHLLEYTVRSGDTLGRIAGKFPCVSTVELAAINGVRAPAYVIRVGQRLRIPQCR